jgi:HD-GYP domain-containing protein (c-di-GMP phosphodiesterase class II)
MAVELRRSKGVQSGRATMTLPAMSRRSPLMLAEQLVGEARARRARAMPRAEAIVRGVSAALFLAAAIAIALLIPSERSPDALLVLGLLVAYALVSRVRFEFGDSYVVPEQLMYVPLVVLAPLNLVPLIVAAASVLAVLPDLIRGTWHWDRTITSVGDCWLFVGPVLVLAALAPETGQLADAPVYALALAAQLLLDLGWSLIRDHYVDDIPLKERVAFFFGTARVDVVLSPLAFIVGITAAVEPATILVIAPLVWLLKVFSQDRQERYAAALELHRAYRGTVMLLSDVIEFDDQYTADHSRSVVDLVHAVADELGIDSERRQELEFAALLHDIGKITIPKEILNKPAALTDPEFEVMKTHTIEGQFMLDRVGGLLGRVGETVRSCHERWDGTGYPDGLAGADIPLESRIVFACDAFNAMTTDRVYRRAMSVEEALAEIRRNSGTQFDPQVVQALLRAVVNRQAVTSPVDEVRAILAAQVPHRVGAST